MLLQMHTLYLYIYKHNNRSLQKVQTNLQFQLTLAQALTAGVVAMRLGPGRYPTQIFSRLKGKHFPYRSKAKKAMCSMCLQEIITIQKKCTKEQIIQREENQNMVSKV